MLNENGIITLQSKRWWFIWMKDGRLLLILIIPKMSLLVQSKGLNLLKLMMKYYRN
jgi:hypothetical protein